MTTRHHLKTNNIEHIKRFLEDSGLSKPDLSVKLGMSRTAVTKWFEDGAAPKWTLLAIEALERRSNKSGSAIFLIKSESPEVTKMFEAIIGANPHITHQSLDEGWK